MEANGLRYLKWLSLLAFLHLGVFLVYLNANIVNVGDLGVALPALAFCVVISLLVFAILWLQGKLVFRLHLFLFLMLIAAWLSLRVIIDLNDLAYLKSITVSTTGGSYILRG